MEPTDGNYCLLNSVHARNDMVTKVNQQDKGRAGKYGKELESVFSSGEMMIRGRNYYYYFPFVIFIGPSSYNTSFINLFHLPQLIVVAVVVKSCVRAEVMNERWKGNNDFLRFSSPIASLIFFSIFPLFHSSNTRQDVFLPS